MNMKNNDDGTTALMFAAKFNNESMVSLLNTLIHLPKSLQAG